MAPKPTAAPKPYEHQEYPKVLYDNEGKSHLVKSAGEEKRLLKHPDKTFAESPADFLPEGHPDRPDTVIEDDEPEFPAGEDVNEDDPGHVKALGLAAGVKGRRPKPTPPIAATPEPEPKK